MAEGGPAGDAKVLELRVHGVDNTTPATLLDLPPGAVRLVAGDKLGSFWEPTPDAVRSMTGAPPDERGSIPPGIRRGAYSWGGMVRTIPDFGGLGVGGVVAAVFARILYALVLPFSIGNAVQWSRTLTTPDASPDLRAKATAGAARLFGLVLTLLYTTTAVTLAVDIVALQCGPAPARCEPLSGALMALHGLTEGQRLAMLALVPIGAIAVLAVFSTVSRLRYDVLPGMELHKEETTVRDRAGRRIEIASPRQGAPLAPASVLAQPGFWSNRHTAPLSRTHVAASVLLTTAFVAGQAAAGPWHAWFTVVFWTSCALLTAAVIVVWAVPTMTARAPADGDDDADGEGYDRPERPWTRIPSILLLLSSGALFLFALGPLAIAPSWRLASEPLLPADALPLPLVAAGSVLALTGIWWRRGGRRKETAWFGCAPAVLMTLALTVGVAISSIVVVTIADWLNGAHGPAALIGEDAAAEPLRPISLTWVDRASGATGEVLIGEDAGPGVRVASTYVVLGTLIVVALLVTLVVAAIGAATKRIGDVRAAAWGAPTAPEHITYPAGGVLPPSRRALLDRIVAARTRAARLHIVEPVVGVLAAASGVALAVSLAVLLWTIMTGTSMMTFLPGAIVANTLDVGIWLLAIAGIVLLVLLATGGSGEGTRPLGTVWDIACFLPRTGHPFGPPCYAERAVPELAGHLSSWLERDGRRAVLSAHSMGAVLSLAALALLASSARTRPALARISLLTYGVQLRPIFGRILPELLGPDVLGVHSAAPPRIWAHDPWDRDFAEQRALPQPPAPPTRAGVRRALLDRLAGPQRPTGTVSGSLLRAEQGGSPLAPPAVRWVNLWRLTDYLGYPAFSTAPGAADGSWANDLDRVVDELDTSGYLVAVGTHNGYWRTSGYTDALLQLARKPRS